MSRIKESLLEMLKCTICLEQIAEQKALPCQHTLCLDCLLKLQTRSNRLKCPVCNKELTIPNGGVKEFPDSLVTRQISDAINAQKSSTGASDTNTTDNSNQEKAVGHRSSGSSTIAGFISGGFGVVPTSRKQGNSPSGNTGEDNKGAKVKEGCAGNSPNSSESLPTKDSTKPAKQAIEQSVPRSAAVKLWKELNDAQQSGNDKLKNADDLIKHYSIVRENLDDKIQARKDEIKAYQLKMVSLCQDKIKGLNQLSGENKTELDEEINLIKPKSDVLRDHMKRLPELRKKLQSKDCSQKHYKDAQECLKVLKVLTMDKSIAKGLAEKEGTFKAGDSVRVDHDRPLGKDVAEFVNDQITHSSVGVFQGMVKKQFPTPFGFPMELDMAVVCFPWKWIGPVERMRRSGKSANLPSSGDRVCVRSSVTKPHFQWHGVRAKKSRGIMKNIENSGPDNDCIVTVDFPECRNWKGLYSEIELVTGCGFEVGDKVRMSSFIPEPSRGWAGVNGSSIGTVKSIDGTKGSEEIIVRFPECKEWMGSESELELSKTPAVGEKVQVKLTVTKPTLDWGGVTHDKIGVLEKIINDDYELGNVGLVRFPGRKLHWSCLLNELEPARYQPPNYGSHLDAEDLRLHFENMMLGGNLPF